MNNSKLTYRFAQFFVFLGIGLLLYQPLLAGDSVLVLKACKIGIVDEDRILYGLEEGQEAERLLQLYKDSLEQEVKKVALLYDTKLEHYKRLEPSVDSAAFYYLKRELSFLELSLGNLQEAVVSLYEAKQAALIKPLHSKVQTAVDAIVRQHGLLYVLSAGEVVYPDLALDGKVKFKGDCKIAHFSAESVLNAMPQTQKAQDTIQTMQTSLAMEYDQLGQQYVAAMKELEKLDLVDPKAIEAQQKKVARLETALNKFKVDAEQKLLRKRGELLEAVITKMRQAAREVAQKEGIQLVLNSDHGMLAQGEGSRDIMQEMMAKLGISTSNAP